MRTTRIKDILHRTQSRRSEDCSAAAASMAHADSAVWLGPCPNSLQVHVPTPKVCILACLNHVKSGTFGTAQQKLLSNDHSAAVCMHTLQAATGDGRAILSDCHWAAHSLAGTQVPGHAAIPQYVTAPQQLCKGLGPHVTSGGAQPVTGRDHGNWWRLQGKQPGQRRATIPTAHVQHAHDTR
jgi:hypothetical protein